MNSDERFQMIVLYVALAVVVLIAIVRHYSVIDNCERKQCERGVPMVVRDQSKVMSFDECICVERPK